MRLNKKTGIVTLSELERKLPLGALQKEILDNGFVVGRATAARARIAGRFIPDYRRLVASRLLWEYVDGWVYLTEYELKDSSYSVMIKFCVTSSTARRALERGWFEVNKFNRDKVDVPADRLSLKPPGQKKK